uniref:Uncharacterized protein n=1 Tax=Anguilla anguilla TaxID=7936 RepID=A0A0E9S8U4_ANGAN
MEWCVLFVLSANFPLIHCLS